MLKTYYYWNNEVFTDTEELKDYIIDFVMEHQNDKIISMMNEVGCDWNDVHDCEVCRANAIELLVLDIMQYEVKIKNELFTTSGKQIKNLPEIYDEIARTELCLTVYY